MNKRFEYIQPKEGQNLKYDSLRELASELEDLIEKICPQSRETSLALTHLEQSIMWANKSISRE